MSKVKVFESEVFGTTDWFNGDVDVYGVKQSSLITEEQECSWPVIYPRTVSGTYTYGPGYWSDEMIYEPDVVRNVSAVTGTLDQLVGGYGYGFVADDNSLIVQDWQGTVAHIRYLFPSGPTDTLNASLAWRMALMEPHKLAILNLNPSVLCRLSKVDFTTSEVTTLYDSTAGLGYIEANSDWMIWAYKSGDQVLYWYRFESTGFLQPIHMVFYKWNWTKGTGGVVTDLALGSAGWGTNGGQVFYNNKIYGGLTNSGSNVRTTMHGFIFDINTETATLLSHELTEDPDNTYFNSMVPYISLNRIYMIIQNYSLPSVSFYKCYLDLNDNLFKGFAPVGSNSAFQYLGACSSTKAYYILGGTTYADRGKVYDYADGSLVANVGINNLNRDFPCRTVDGENRIWRITADNTLTGYLLDGSMSSRSVALSGSLPVPTVGNPPARRVFPRDGRFYIHVYGMSTGDRGRTYRVL